jgi:hypothetical protein
MEKTFFPRWDNTRISKALVCVTASDFISDRWKIVMQEMLNWPGTTAAKVRGRTCLPCGGGGRPGSAFPIAAIIPTRVTLRRNGKDDRDCTAESRCAGEQRIHGPNIPRISIQADKFQIGLHPQQDSAKHARLDVQDP